MSNAVINQARKILEAHTNKELAAKVGIGANNFSFLRSGKRTLTENMAARIVEAYAGDRGKRKAKAAEKPETPVKASAAAERKGWGAPNNPTGISSEQRQAKQDKAKLAEEAYALLSKMGMAGAARASLAKVIEEEIRPMLEEMIQRAVGEALRPSGMTVMEALEAEGGDVTLSSDTKGNISVLRDGAEIPEEEVDKACAKVRASAFIPRTSSHIGLDPRLTEISMQYLKPEDEPLRPELYPHPLPAIGPDPDPDEPSGYCPSDLPGRGRNAPKEKRRRLWRR